MLSSKDLSRLMASMEEVSPAVSISVAESVDRPSAIAVILPTSNPPAKEPITLPIPAAPPSMNSWKPSILDRPPQAAITPPIMAAIPRRPNRPAARPPKLSIPMAVTTPPKDRIILDRPPAKASMDAVSISLTLFMA